MLFPLGHPQHSHVGESAGCAVSAVPCKPKIYGDLAYDLGKGGRRKPDGIEALLILNNAVQLVADALAPLEISDRFIHFFVHLAARQEEA